MATKWQRIRVDVDPDLKPRERQLVAEEIIDFILLRTQAGKDKNDKKFEPYSKEYAKRSGVGRGDVDLFLSGEMLGDLELLSHKRGSILIGFERGSDSNAKADGNIRGTYGRPSPIPGKQRDFLGIKKKEVRDLVRSIKFDES